MRKLKGFFLKWLGTQRASAYDQAKINRILVFRYDRIGDMVVTSPFLRALAEGFPKATVDVLCSQINSHILENCPGIADRLIYIPGLGGLLRLWTLRRRYDLVVDLNHSVIWHDLIALRLLAPRFCACVHKDGRYGVAGGDLSIYSVMSKRHSLGMRRPIAEVYLDLAEDLLRGGQAKQALSSHYFLPLSPEEIHHAERHAGVRKGDLIIGLNQHGGRPQMHLRDDDMLELCQLVRQRLTSATILWFAAPEMFQAVCDLAKRLRDPNLAVWRPTPNIRPVCAIMPSLSLLVTPDTSLVHIAAAFDVPTVAIYANEPELVAQWVPHSNDIKVLLSESKKSLEGYSLQDLLRAVEDRLARLPTHSKTL